MSRSRMWREISRYCTIWKSVARDGHLGMSVVCFWKRAKKKNSEKIRLSVSFDQFPLGRFNFKAAAMPCGRTVGCANGCAAERVPAHVSLGWNECYSRMNADALCLHLGRFDCGFKWSENGCDGDPCRGAFKRALRTHVVLHAYPQPIRNETNIFLEQTKLCGKSAWNLLWFFSKFSRKILTSDEIQTDQTAVHCVKWKQSKLNSSFWNAIQVAIWTLMDSLWETSTVRVLGCQWDETECIRTFRNVIAALSER